MPPSRSHGDTLSLSASVEPLLVSVSVWVSLPLGSVGSVSSVQFGGELRIAFDVDSVATKGEGRRADEYDFE